MFRNMFVTRDAAGNINGVRTGRIVIAVLLFGLLCWGVPFLATHLDVNFNNDRADAISDHSSDLRTEISEFETEKGEVERAISGAPVATPSQTVNPPAVTSAPTSNPALEQLKKDIAGIE